jgi:hypothetical protein
MLQRSTMPPLPTMVEHPVSSSPAHNAASAMSISAGSPSMRGHHMHAFMDMNNTLLHEHATGRDSSHSKELQASPLVQMQNAHGLPTPPPLSLPQVGRFLVTVFARALLIALRETILLTLFRRLWGASREKV